MKLSVSIFSTVTALAFIGNANADTSFLSTCASQLVDSLTNLLQTGKASSNFGQCAQDNSGNGYAAGIINFTTANGDAWQVVKLYMQSQGYTGEFDDYKDKIDTYASKGSGSSTNGLSGFCSAWEKAANVSMSAFLGCQDEVLSSVYYTPASTQATSLNLKTDVGKAVLVDTAIVDGPGSDSSSLGGLVLATLNSINGTITGDSGNNILIYGTYPVDEIEWIKLFLKERLKKNPADKANVASYEYIISNNSYYWDDDSISVLNANGGKKTLTCLTS
ncbi:hypothetical protein EV175_002579 [Coemansia sp. RSA 1933]|nr:hypothetical protein EV175_002579 [Coemansia sp. RSA 1933]